MARPFTRRQALQNAHFIEVLGQTGNARLAARQLGFNRSTFTKRRAKNAAFAASWEAALAAAHARFNLAGGARPAEPASTRQGFLRTKGGEPVVVRTKNGRLQLRLAPRGRMTKAAEQAFFRAPSASANVRLSAAAAGFTHSSFYARARKAPAFAREFRLALRMGYERLEMAALRAALPESHADDAWRHHDPLPILPMSAEQALQLLFLHQKSVRQGWDQPHRRRRRNETDEQHAMRLLLMWRAEQRQIAEERAVARAEHYEASGSWWLPDEAPPPALPPLHLVTGWSKADPGKKPRHPDVALFGGWRIEDMRRKMGET